MTFKEMVSKMLEGAKGNKEVSSEVEKLNKSFLFNIAGSGTFNLVLKPGELRLNDGPIPGPSATISASEEVLNNVFSGKLDAVKAFMSGQLKVSGDIFAAQKLTELAKKAVK